MGYERLLDVGLQNWLPLLRSMVSSNPILITRFSLCGKARYKFMCLFMLMILLCQAMIIRPFKHNI